eukprot:811690-Pyramimonas_sp.AAC.1
MGRDQDLHRSFCLQSWSSSPSSFPPGDVRFFAGTRSKETSTGMGIRRQGTILRWQRFRSAAHGPFYRFRKVDGSLGFEDA